MQRRFVVRISCVPRRNSRIDQPCLPGASSSNIVSCGRSLAASPPPSKPMSIPAETPLTAVFAYRSPAAFIGVLGSLLAGNGYVPLNRTFPIERTQVMLERSGCRSIVVDEGSLPQLNKLLETGSSPLLVLTPDALDFTSYKQQWPQHTFLAAHELKPAESWREPAFETRFHRLPPVYFWQHRHSQGRCRGSA